MAERARTSALLHVALQDKWFALDINMYLPSGIYRTVKDVIHGMLRRLHNGLKVIYLKSEETVTSLGGNQCFYIHENAQDFFELKLLPGWYVTLPKTSARALGYLISLWTHITLSLLTTLVTPWGSEP